MGSLILMILDRKGPVIEEGAQAGLEERNLGLESGAWTS